MPLSLSLLLLATTVGDGFFEQEGACVCQSLYVFRLQGQGGAGFCLSFAARACAGAVLFFCLLICLNSDPTWEEELRGLFCLSVCREINTYL